MSSLRVRHARLDVRHAVFRRAVSDGSAHHQIGRAATCTILVRAMLDARTRVSASSVSTQSQPKPQWSPGRNAAWWGLKSCLCSPKSCVLLPRRRASCSAEWSGDISRIEFAPLEMAPLDGVEQLGEQDRADFAPPRPRGVRRPRATGVQIQTRVRSRHQSRATRHSA